MARKQKPKEAPDVAEDDEPMAARGTIMTQIDCPACGDVFDLEGDRDAEQIECEQCNAKLVVRRL